MWGPRLYDARGNRIEWPNAPRIGDVIKTGRTVQFYRRDPVADGAAEALGYRVGETRDVPCGSYNPGYNTKGVGSDEVGDPK